MLDKIMKVAGKVCAITFVVGFYAIVCLLVLGGTVKAASWTRTVIMEVYNGSK
jgi:hypothetical protein